MDQVSAMKPMQSVMGGDELTRLEQFVNGHNKALKEEGRLAKKDLGQEDFLKLMLTQLAYQDPTAPMDDKESIAQMAQFSSLNQMTSMATDIAKLTAILSGNEAVSALDKNVEVKQGDTTIQGRVQSVSRGGDVPEIMVNGSFYKWDQVQRVYGDESL